MGTCHRGPVEFRGSAQSPPRRRLCRDAILKYIDLDAVGEWEETLAAERERCKKALPKAVKKVLRAGLKELDKG